MAHTVHTTEALILEATNFDEASRWYFLLTPDFGLITARAQGVRENKSKLRGHLNHLRLVNVSLVLGREYWHLVGAEKVLDLTFSVGSRESFQPLARVARLLRRLLPEAAPDPELFALVRDGFSSLLASTLTTEEREVAEVVLVWNILRLLGHIEYPNPDAAALLSGSLAPERRARLTAEINTALSHSQL